MLAALNDVEKCTYSIRRPHTTAYWSRAAPSANNQHNIRDAQRCYTDKKIPTRAVVKPAIRIDVHFLSEIFQGRNSEVGEETSGFQDGSSSHRARLTGRH